MTKEIDKRFYRIDEVEELLNLTKPEVYELLKDGGLQAIKVSDKPGGIRISRESIDDYVKRGILPVYRVEDFEGQSISLAKDVQKRLKMGSRELWKLLHREKIRFFYEGGESFILSEDLESYLQRIDENGTNIDNPRYDEKGREIYFIQSELGGPIKIGSSNNSDRRLLQLQYFNPFKLVILKVLENKGYRLESDLHIKFKHIRLRGEWFQPEQALLDFIKSV